MLIGIFLGLVVGLVVGLIAILVFFRGNDNTNNDWFDKTFDFNGDVGFGKDR